MDQMTSLPPDLLPAARIYLDAFPKGDVAIFPLTALDRTGLPVWVAAFFPADPGLHGLMPYGVGYGMTDEAAVLGALGEAAEMLWPTLGLRDKPRTRDSYSELAASLGTHGIVDPLTVGRPAGSPVDRDTVLEWVEGTRAKDGSAVLVPIDSTVVAHGLGPVGPVTAAAWATRKPPPGTAATASTDCPSGTLSWRSRRPVRAS